MSVTVSCDLRASFGGIRNQGSRPTCVAFAVSDAHAAARGSVAPLSVEHLYHHAVRRTAGGHPDHGVSLGRMLEALRYDGQSVESGWPYIAQLPTDLSLWVPPATATPVFKRDSATRGAAINTIIEQLDIGIPVVVTFLVSEAFCRAEGGVIESHSSDADVDWHAVIAVGHAQARAKRLLLVRNSWGEAWGLGGYAWLHTDYLAPRLGGIATMASTGSV